MKIKILTKKDNSLDFLVEDITTPFANALRRICISEVPTLAIEWVDFHKNNSVLFDEMIAHRLGLLPLVFDPNKMTMTDECSCKGKGCPLCQVVFALEKTGPCMTHSGDMKSSNNTVKPTDPNFLIVELLKKHEIKLEAIARIGTGIKNAKWQAANASYQYYPELEVNGNVNPSEIVKKCPKGILAIKNKKLVLTDPIKCDICRSCEINGVKIKCNENKFIFRIESISGLKPEYIMTKAAEILIEKSDEFKKNLSKI